MLTANRCDLALDLGYAVFNVIGVKTLDVDPEKVPSRSDVSDQCSERLLRRLVEDENLGLPSVNRIAEAP
nr:hypothetical protein [Mesorhizobium sp.]